LPELIAGAPVGVSEIMNLTKHAGDSGNLLTALRCFYIWKKICTILPSGYRKVNVVFE
jgi:hypothetical protein